MPLFDTFPIRGMGLSGCARPRLHTSFRYAGGCAATEASLPES